MQPQSQPVRSTLAGIAVLTVAALFTVAAAFLLYTHAIDFSGAITLFGLSAGTLGVNGAFNAPSPSQQAQTNALFAQVMDVLPALATQMQAPPVVIQNTLPAAAPAPAPQPAPLPAQVAQQAFPASTLPPPSWTQQVPAVTP